MPINIHLGLSVYMPPSAKLCLSTTVIWDCRSVAYTTFYIIMPINIHMGLSVCSVYHLLHDYAYQHSFGTVGLHATFCISIPINNSHLGQSVYMTPRWPVGWDVALACWRPGFKSRPSHTSEIKPDILAASGRMLCVKGYALVLVCPVSI